MLHTSQDLLLAAAAALVMTVDATSLDSVSNLQMNVFQSAVNLSMQFGDTFGTGEAVVMNNPEATLDAMDSVVDENVTEDEDAKEEEEEVAAYDSDADDDGVPTQMPEDALADSTCTVYEEENY